MIPTQFSAESKWPYGKSYKGLTVSQIPPHHLRWALAQAKEHPLTTGFTPDMCKVMRAELKRRKK